MITHRPTRAFAAGGAVTAVAAFAVGLAAGCSSRSSSPPRVKVRLWHAFNAAETEALGRALARWPGGSKDGAAEVELFSETFARGQTMLRKTLESGQNCPDLARIDATWLPGFADLLAPVPAGVDEGTPRLPAALALGALRGVRYGIPQAVDGLALVYRVDTVAANTDAFLLADATWPPRTADDLVAAAGALSSPADGRYGLGVRDDGYWFVAFLRAWGGALVDPDTGALGIDTPASREALARFAGLFGTVAPPPAPAGKAAEAEARQFRAGELPIVVTGPWAIAELTGGGTEGLGVAALPGAPLGGQLFVVPRCAAQPERAWALAEFLASPDIQAEWAAKLGVIPTAEGSLARAGAFARAFFEALGSAEPLPRHPITAELFEDLSPAVSQVVARHATAAEVQAVIARAWSRLLERHGITPRPWREPAASP